MVQLSDRIYYSTPALSKFQYNDIFPLFFTILFIYAENLAALSLKQIEKHLNTSNVLEVFSSLMSLQYPVEGKISTIQNASDSQCNLYIFREDCRT